MDRDVDHLAQSSQEFFNWQNVFRSFPLPILSGAVLLGYILVPTKRKMSGEVKPLLAAHSPAAEVAPTTSVLGSVLSTAVSVAGRAALSAGMAFGQRYLLQFLTAQLDAGTRPLQPKEHS